MIEYLLAAAAVQAAAGDVPPAMARDECAETGQYVATLPYLRLLDPPSGTAALRTQNEQLARLNAALKSALATQGAENVVASGSVGNTFNGGGQRGYTRLSINFTPCAGSLRSYPGEARAPVTRWLLGKNISKLLKAKAAITPTELNATLNLANLVRDSGSKGDVWSSEVSNARQLLPFFRIDNSSNVHLEFEFSADRKADFGGTSKMLNIISRAAGLISPSTALVTSENIGKFNESAQFVDQSVSDLLKEAISEKLVKDVPLSGWDGRTPLPLATLLLAVPSGNRIKGKASVALGKWEFVAEPLLESIFEPAAGGSGNPSSAAIMNFSVADNKSLLDALAGEESVATARDALVKLKANAGQAAFGEAARKLCSALALKADRLGLSPKDVHYAVAAYADLQSPGGAAGTALTSACAPASHS